MNAQPIAATEQKDYGYEVRVGGRCKPPSEVVERGAKLMGYYFIRSVIVPLGLFSNAVGIVAVLVDLVVSEIGGRLGIVERWLLHEHDDRLQQIEYGGGYIRTCKNCGRTKYEKR